MKLNFTHEIEKDVWCLATKGPRSNNSPKPTRIYEELIKEAGQAPSNDDIARFITGYISRHDINPDTKITQWQDYWQKISQEFIAIAESIFQLSLEQDLTAYATINTRCPYNIEEGWFFISLQQENPNPIIMHELWHFYTWERFGKDEARLGKAAYNTAKEALTVLLNVECGHLFPDSKRDQGYPQHQDIRTDISTWWQESRNIDQVWHMATSNQGSA